MSDKPVKSSSEVVTVQAFADAIGLAIENNDPERALAYSEELKNQLDTCLCALDSLKRCTCPSFTNRQTFDRLSRATSVFPEGKHIGTLIGVFYERDTKPEPCVAFDISIRKSRTLAVGELVTYRLPVKTHMNTIASTLDILGLYEKFIDSGNPARLRCSVDIMVEARKMTPGTVVLLRKLTDDEARQDP